MHSMHIWPLHSGGPSEPKLMKNLTEKGAWAYPESTPFYLRNG